jgi:alpha-galactosidase
MKKFIFIAFIFVLWPAVINSQASNFVKADNWIKEKFTRGAVPPFSFIYGGRSSNSFITSWDYKAEELPSPEKDVKNTLFTYTDKQTGLVVKCFVACYADYNAAEYVLRFSNTSERNTPILENAAVIDNTFSYNTEGTFTLYHSLGSNGAVNDFQPFDEKMQIGKNIYMTPAGGRSSDKTALPFFNIESPEKQGIVVAVGWTGKWFADAVQKDEKSVSIKSGMESMRLFLYPHEEIRTPGICLLFWNGESRLNGHNQFRRFILSHHTRKINGKNPVLPISAAFELDGVPAPCSVHSCVTETSAIAQITRYRMFKFTPELFWLDAGWYSGCGWNIEEGDWGSTVGNWSINKDRFPNGFKAISNAAHASNAKFMVWFEPERVRLGSEIQKKHPEWLLSKPNSDIYLLDIGNPEVRMELTNYLSDFIKNEGVDYYRQDFNMDPAPYWKENDSAGRTGISEIRHIEGLYAVWDSLLARFPSLIIDNCAAGGRRIDLETTSRSTPFWRTDLEQNAVGYQNHTYGLNLYLPLHGTALFRTGKYYFRSGLGSLGVINWSSNGSNSETIYSYQKYIEDFKRLREYFLADYYPLTPLRKHYMDDDFWMAYQFDRPEKNDGIVLVFRREKNTDELMNIKFKGLNASSVYELYYEDYEIKLNKTGGELMAGIDVKISEKPASVLISYKKIK